MLPIAMTTPKLDALRSHNHVSKLYLSIYQPNVVMNGRVNSTSLVRGSRTIPYDNSVSGTWANIEEGMTLWVGSASGTFDLGKVRVRSATNSQLVIAENEYIQWSDNQYLTVVNYVDLVAVFPRLVQDTGDATVVNFYKDYDIAYTDQNRVLGAFVCAGSHRAGFKDDYGRAEFYFSATGTYPMVSGSAVRYNWSFPGGVATGTASMTPGIVMYSGTGNYVAKLQVTVTGTTNAIETTYRYVSVYDKPNRGLNVPIRRWRFSDLAGSRDDGGFRGKVDVYEQLNYKLSGGELVVIFSDDEFNGVPQNIDIGTVRPDDNILFVGYIMNDSVEYDYEKSKVSFDIGSPSEMLKQGENFAISVESMSNPSAWWHFYDMTTKKAMYHYIKWHSTLMKVADIFWLGKDYYVQFFDSERTNMWDAMKAFMKPTLIGDISCNNKGQVVFQTEPESFEIPTESYPKIMTLSDRDIVGQVDIGENLFGELSYLEMGGIEYDGALNGNASYPKLSASPGTAPKYYGKNNSNQGLALLDQDNLNQITGNVYAKANASPQSFRAQMAGNYRFTLAPLNMVDVYVPANRTIQNKMISGTYYANNLNYNYDAENGYLSSSMEFVQVVNGIPGATLEIKPPNELAPLVFPPLIFPSFSFGFGTAIKFVAILTNDRGIWFTENFDAEYPIWFSCGISYASYTNKNVTSTDVPSTIYNMEVTPSGLVVALGEVAVYSGEIGILSPFSTMEQLVDDIEDFDDIYNHLHPRFYVAGVGDGGNVGVVAGHVYSSKASAKTYLYGGTVGGISKGQELTAGFRARFVGSASNSGGGWFLTYGGWPLGGNDNVAIYSPDGFNIGNNAFALDGTTSLAIGFYHTSSPTGLKYLHGVRGSEPVSAIYALSDVFDNETSVFDVVDTSDVTYPCTLAVNPSGHVLRVAGTGLRLSKDGGTSWTGISGSGAWAGDITDGGVCAGKDVGSWIMAKNQLVSDCGVYYTPDDGVTWIDKTGNLRNYFTNDFECRVIKAVL